MRIQGTARWCLADWIASAIAGSSTDYAAAVNGTQSGWAGLGSCTVVGEPLGYPIETAAFLNAYAGEVLEYGHGHAGGGGHLGAPTIPVALALSEVASLDSRDALAAIVVGYEIFSRVGAGVSPALLTNGFVSTGIVGAIGAAATAARAMGMSANEMARGLGAAAYLAPVSLLSEYSGTVNSCEAAQAARVGLAAASLARAGLGGSGDPISAFFSQFGNADELRRSLDGLGTVYEGANLYFKPYPGCRFTHGAVEATAQLLEETRIRPSAIEHVIVRVTPSSLRLCGNHTAPDASLVETQFSIPYIVATLILDGEFSASSFSRERRSRRATHDFARDRISVELGWPDDNDVDLAASEVELTGSGRRTVVSILEPKGSPRNPMTTEDLRAKFLSMTVSHLGRGRADALLEQILHLGGVGSSDVAGILAAVQESSGASPSRLEATGKSDGFRA